MPDGHVQLTHPGGPGAAGLKALLWPGLAALVAFGILVGLGSWQLARRAWKHDLIARIEARAHGAPGAILPESAWPGWSAEADEFRRVELTGTFDHGRAVAVHGLLHDRPGRPVQGYVLLTPLRREDGSVVIVNRGFVPPELKDAQLRPDAEPAGPVRVTGLVRAPERRGWFVPENGPGGWFVRDVAAIAREKGLSRTAPFYVDLVAGPDPNAWPRAGQTRLSLPDNHLGYAFTWFGLAGTLAGVFGVFALRRLTGRGEGLDGGAEVATAAPRERPAP